MDGIIQCVLSSTKKDEFVNLRKYLDQHAGPLIKKNPSCLTALLESLDLTKHSVAWCLLLSKYVPTSGNRSAFLTQVEILFAHLDVQQVRDACADRLGVVSHKYAEACRGASTPGRGIPHLLHALEKLRPASDHLTALHADYICLCLLQKQYSLASDLLSKPIFNVSPVEGGTTPRDFMLYYYYGGMVWIGLKQFDKALTFFERCICTPATCLSAIVVEAFKKYIFVSLIHKGKVPLWMQLPKHCPRAVVKGLKRYSTPYVEFARLFMAGQRAGCDLKHHEELREMLFTTHKAQFQEDKNFGLAKQAFTAFTRLGISRLTLTYDTLSLEAIAAKAGLSSASEAEALIVRMVAKKQVSARIDDCNGMAHFLDEPSSGNAASINSQLAAVKALALRVQAMNEGVLSSKDYVLKQMRKDPAHKDDFVPSVDKRKKNLMDAVFGALKG